MAPPFFIVCRHRRHRRGRDKTMADENTENEEETTESSIELVVEDGTCVKGANSYMTLDDAVKYQTERGRSEWLALDDDAKMASIIKGTQYVDSLYVWKGRRKYREQSLSFPRVMLRDLDGFPVEGIPQQVKAAVLEAAFYGYKAELFTVRSSEDAGVKRDRKKVDVIETEVEYFNDDEKEVDYISKYAALDSLLKGLYIPRNWSGSVNTRAVWRG